VLLLLLCYQVFAPINDAFSGVLTKYLEEEWKAHLTNILLYHVSEGEIFSGDLEADMIADMLNGESVNVTSIDPVQINGVDVVLADVNASNGVIHAIDEVLLPTSATSDIVDIAASDAQFTTLVELVTMAELVDTLKGEGPFTVFAPTNDAFSKLPAETIESLTDPANKEALIDVLTYHVVPGIILSSELSEGAISVATQRAAVNGDTLIVTSVDPVTINDANVVEVDLLASNGIIHVIDTVLIPPADESTPADDSTPPADEQASGASPEEATSSAATSSVLRIGFIVASIFSTFFM